jgi:hypothetical protein
MREVKCLVTEAGYDRDPRPWDDDGGATRVPIYDHAFGQRRLVRRVGWVRCLSQFHSDPASRVEPHRFLSPDVAKVRVCPDCKDRVRHEHYRHGNSIFGSAQI